MPNQFSRRFIPRKPTVFEAKRLLRARILVETRVYRLRGKMITMLPDQEIPPRGGPFGWLEELLDQWGQEVAA